MAKGKRKIGELQTPAYHYEVFCDPYDINPYKVYRKWYDQGWHRKLITKYADLFSVTCLVNQLVKEEACFW